MHRNFERLFISRSQNACCRFIYCSKLLRSLKIHVSLLNDNFIGMINKQISKQSDCERRIPYHFNVNSIAIFVLYFISVSRAIREGNNRITRATMQKRSNRISSVWDIGNVYTGNLVQIVLDFDDKFFDHFCREEKCIEKLFLPNLMFSF